MTNYVCMYVCRDLQFKIETFHGNFIYPQSFCQISVEENSDREIYVYIFRIVEVSDLGFKPWPHD